MKRTPDEVRYKKRKDCHKRQKNPVTSKSPTNKSAKAVISPERSTTRSKELIAGANSRLLGASAGTSPRGDEIPVATVLDASDSSVSSSTEEPKLPGGGVNSG